MKTSIQERRKRALSRFRVLPFNEWVKAKHITVNDKPIGLVPDVDLMDEHARYCERKAIERASLEGRN